MNEIWSLDECHFQQHGGRCAMWIPPEEKDPIVLHAPTKKNVSLFGALNLSSGRLIHTISPVFNAVTFADFLKKLFKHCSKQKRIYLILDNAKYHHAVMLKPWLKKHKHRLTLLFLPPYSPELNPVERVWKLTRRNCTHNQFFPSIDGLIQKVKEQFIRWDTPNNVLYKLCCII